jgi:hypothetical protein
MTEIVLVTTLQRRQKIVKNKIRAQVGTATGQRTDGGPASARRAGAQRAEARHAGARRAGARLGEAPRRGGSTGNRHRPPTHPSSYGMGAHKTTGNTNYFRGNQFNSSDSDPDSHGASFELSSYKVHKNNWEREVKSEDWNYGITFFLSSQSQTRIRIHAEKLVTSIQNS